MESPGIPGRFNPVPVQRFEYTFGHGENSALQAHVLSLGVRKGTNEFYEVVKLRTAASPRTAKRKLQVAKVAWDLRMLLLESRENIVGLPRLLTHGLEQELVLFGVMKLLHKGCDKGQASLKDAGVRRDSVGSGQRHLPKNP